MEGKYCYEKEVFTNGTNREIHYLYGGNGLAGIYVRTDGKDTLFATVTDRQNSLTAVMDVATGLTPLSWYKSQDSPRKNIFSESIAVSENILTFAVDF